MSPPPKPDPKRQKPNQPNQAPKLTNQTPQILFLPFLISSILYLLLAHLLLPLYRTHRARYNNYLPMPASLSSTSDSIRSRAANFLTRLALPRSQAQTSASGGVRRDSSEDLFGDEEGETMVGFDYRDRTERGVRGGRVESLWSDGRLSRDLEEGFRDDSSEEGENERTGRGRG